MSGVIMIKRAFRTIAPALLVAALLSPTLASAQRGAGGPAGPARSPKDSATVDITGNWVSIVNEDWIYRMVTPKKGDFPGLPLTKAAQDAANAWDPATDGSCKAYGVGGIMRMPGRLKINWAGDDVLKIETDAGVQTRMLMFGKRPDAGTPATLQGFSAAQWERPNLVPAQVAGGIQVGAAFQPPGGDLKVITTNTSGGWVRKNGVPYSPNTRVTEYFDRFKGPDGADWLTVLTEVEDPANFNGPYLTSTHFKREPDGSKWRPKPCSP
jgi:hypothetical protein